MTIYMPTRLPVAPEPSQRPPVHPIPASSDSEPPPSELGEEVEDEESLYKAICDSKWRSAKTFLEKHPSAVSAKITSSGKTALHVAAMFGHVSIVEELVNLMPPEDLKNVDDFGITPLLIATVTGVTRVAECMVNKNKDVVAIATPACELPVTLAFLNGHRRMGRYLYSVTPVECLKKGTQGPKLLRCCLQTQCLDIVADVLQKCEELLFACDIDGWKPIVGIATMCSAFLGGSELVFWKRWIYNSIKIQSTINIKDVRIDIQQGENKRVQGKLMVPGIMREIYELKLMHAQASQILRLVYLKSLPTKLIIGLSALFISIATMIIAFLATIGLMLQHSGYSWGLLPVVILASVPVSLFVLLQFPLLFNTIFSTYAGIFNRKVKLWP